MFFNITNYAYTIDDAKETNIFRKSSFDIQILVLIHIASTISHHTLSISWKDLLIAFNHYYNTDRLQSKYELESQKWWMVKRFIDIDCGNEQVDCWRNVVVAKQLYG